jgi:hypothetical protein
MSLWWTLSISSDEGHLGIVRNDYFLDDADAGKTQIADHLLFSHIIVGLPVMEDIDSPFDDREDHPGGILPKYSSTTYTTISEPCETS